MAEKRSVVLETNTLGYKVWTFVGIILSVAIVFYLLSTISSLVIPLIITLVIGALFASTVSYLSNYMPRKLASALVLVGLVVVVAGSMIMVVEGVSDQADEIQRQLVTGVNSLSDELDAAGIELPTGNEIVDRGRDFLSTSSGGISSVLSSTFSTIGGLLAGTFVGMFILYYILSDWDSLTKWLSSHLGVPNDLGQGVVEDSVFSLQRYFYALTVTSIIAAGFIGAVAAVLGVPLAFTIAVITFVTAYIPYIGAIIAGAFAVLIALGSGGVTTALILLAVIIISQTVIQPILANKMSATELEIHPAIAFGSTIIGAAVAGVLGAMLSAPIVAIVIKVTSRIKKYKK